MAETEQDRAQEIVENRDDSRNWMRDAYWGKWERVYKAFKCEMPARKSENEHGELVDDPEKSAIAMPDTFSMVNRRTARVTAQIPSISFVSSPRDEQAEDAVATKVMYDWDQGGVQRWQKLHVRQAELCGISFRRWWWEVEEFTRTRGLPLNRDFTPEEMKLIASTYELDPNYESNPAVMRTLLATQTKRGMLNVKYLYKAYEGARSEVMFIGDCFPFPHFKTIQKSPWFCVQLRWDRETLMKLGKRFKQLQAGINKLFHEFPNGSDPDQSGRRTDGDELYDRLRGAVGMPTRGTTFTTSKSRRAEEWNIIARWTPGINHTVSYVAEDEIFLGEMPGPYDLDGKMPFTELKLIDDILGGVGDSAAGIGIGLQDKHNLEVNKRFDIFRHVTDPMLGTTDRVLHENPELTTRGLMRLILMRQGRDSVWPINDQAAIAAMMQAFPEEGATQRMIQMLAGDSNLSMSANVDPSQLRTATGAKIMQAGQDVLTKDQVDMFHMTSVQPDCEMIYLLNRSEMADAVELDKNRYARNYDVNSDRRKQIWITAEPAHFQVDGRLTVALGSTQAEDMEENVAKATNLFTMLSGHPNVKPEALAREVLIAHGKGPQMAEFLQEAPPPPPEPPTKSSISLTLKGESTEQAVVEALLEQAGVTPEQLDAKRQEAAAQSAAQGAIQPPGIPPAPPQLPTGAPPVDATNILGTAMRPA